jgi:hypothetical protein
MSRVASRVFCMQLPCGPASHTHGWTYRERNSMRHCSVVGMRAAPPSWPMAEARTCEMHGVSDTCRGLMDAGSWADKCQGSAICVPTVRHCRIKFISDLEPSVGVVILWLPLSRSFTLHPPSLSPFSLSAPSPLSQQPFLPLVLSLPPSTSHLAPQPAMSPHPHSRFARHTLEDASVQELHIAWGPSGE